MERSQFKRTAGMLALAGGIAMMALGPASAQEPWPSRPVTIVVPFPAGGGTDAFPTAPSVH